MTRILTAVLFSLLFSGQVWAQASVTAQAFAEVIEALTATETAQLNFGRFSPGVAGGEVIISPDGVKSAQGSVMLSEGTSITGQVYHYRSARCYLQHSTARRPRSTPAPE